jgi:hypothetical protein
MSRPISRVRHFVSETARIPVVGVQARQEAIWGIVGPPDQREDRASWHGDALLEPEPDNPHDPGAVRVSIDGQPVGYLARELAADLQPALRALASRGEAVSVPVYARGGFGLDDGGRASVGLVLRFEPADVRAAAGG